MRCATDRSQRLNDVNGDGRMTADTRPQRVRHAAEASCCHRHHCIGHASEARMAPQPMSLMRHRRYLRALTAAQRSRWFEQRKRLTPRVPIGSAWLPDRVWRSYSYARWI
jgi:hypothetical protein